MSAAKGSWRSVAAVAAALLGCAAPAAPEVDPGLEALAITEVHPGVVLPGTPLDVVGASFVEPTLGLHFVHLAGTFTGDDGSLQAIDVELRADFVDETHLQATSATADPWHALGGAAGSFAGTATVAIDSAIDHQRHTSAALEAVTLRLVPSLTPTVTLVRASTLQVNSLIAVEGDGLLLGGTEGETHVVLNGCFLRADGRPPCRTHGVIVDNVELVAQPATPWDRAHARFAWAPAIGGIHPGRFDGTLALKNVAPGQPPSLTTPLPLGVNVALTSITQFSPASASLGQYVDITGGGFVGGGPGYVTLVRLLGTFTREGTTQAAPVDLALIPRWVGGDRMRYVVDEADQLGHLVDLRTVAGTFTGTATPIVRSGEDEVVGNPAHVTLELAHVKQVVRVSFAASYRASLRLYGLYAADAAVRDRVLTVAARDYGGVNLEWRRDEPTDYALYSEVDVVGPDPNDLSLLGYDNTPGKDVNNVRLYDRIGGVNAITQQDGSPGFGGVFAEQFLGFSSHPPSTVARLPIADPLFDAIFDPLRPDAGGHAASAAEVSTAPRLGDGSQCPSTVRSTQVACAIVVLGNLVGTTLTHEVGHSLGLANPQGDGFHDGPDDLPNRLMESGGNRPFAERAELMGQGPGRFCDAAFTYLQAILPMPTGRDPYTDRPPCNQ